MYKDKILLKSINNIDARPASVFVRESSKYRSDIKLIKDRQSYNAKSIMAVLSMGASEGDILIIEAKGEDEKEAVNDLTQLLENIGN